MTAQRSWLAAALSWAAASACHSPPAPRAGGGDAAATGREALASYQNPILSGFHPDPSICRVGEDFYLATSSFEYFPGVPIFHSKDLVHWRQIGFALSRSSQLELEGVASSQGIFAPTLRHHDGTFYLVTTNVSHGGSFFVTATNPAGPWSEPIWVKEPEFTMDPSLTFASDGRVYYTRHGGGERGGAWQAEIDVRTGQLLGAAQLVWAGTGGVWPEGPHLYEIEGRFYLMLAEGGTSTGHGVTIARAASPFGPFEPYAHNPLLTHADRPEQPIQATGHGDLVQDASGRWWIVFLGIRRWDGQHHHLGRETFLAPVTWTAEGWPLVNGGEPIALSMRAELPPPHPFPEPPGRDDFASGELGLDWNFVRNPRAGSWSLSARPGYLRLSGDHTSLDEVGSPAFVGRRQRHFRATARAALDFAPRSAADRAGLALRANEQNHYELVLTGAPGEREVQLWTTVLGRAEQVAAWRAAEGPVELTIEAYPDRYELAARAGGERHLLGLAPTAPLSTEAAGGFTGVYIGMFAHTTGESPAPPADFDWFEYLPGPD